MSVEKNLIDAAYDYIIDASGEYVTVTDTNPAPLEARRSSPYTPKDSLTSRDSHLLAASTGATVFSRMFGVDVMTRGGSTAYSTPNAALWTRRDGLVVDLTRTILPGIYGTTLYGYSSYGTVGAVTNTYGSGVYGTSTYAAPTGTHYGTSTYGSSQYA